jgi:ketosteroid isomerase-like protein
MTKELTMESRSPEEVVRAWNDAFSRQDIDECMSYMSDDYVRYGDMCWESPMDRESWGTLLKSFNGAFPGWSWEITSFVVSGNTVIVEACESGVWTRPWEFFGISLEPSGEAYDDHDSVHFEVRDGLICQTRVYITNNCARIYQIDKRIAEMADVGTG